MQLPAAILPPACTPQAGTLVRRDRDPWPEDLLPPKGFDRAADVISGWDGYAPTPLRHLSGLAERLGVGALFLKDESPRFGLESFKALGGAYAVGCLVVEHGRDVTVTCATDGNHGRSVAWGAARAGCRCVIYVHRHVSEGRASAIAAYGAEIRRAGANYLESVRQAAAHGWIVVSDTSYPGYTEIPKLVMHGYGLMADEAFDQLQTRPDFVLMQGGVGGLAAAVIARLRQRFGEGGPTVIIVEPDRAACLLASAERGSLSEVEILEETVMAGLSCSEPSLLAWEIIRAGADWFMTIPDHAAEATMRWLARPATADAPLTIGESGVAGLAGLIALAASSENRARVGLDARSKVLVFGTEGATDPAIYQRIVQGSTDYVGETE